MDTKNIFRNTGIEVIGDVPWGSHFCQFYKTKDDLLDVLVPYFRAGLENNEFCVWVTSDFLGTKEAFSALEKGVPDLQKYVRKEQIEIFPHTEWYLKGGKFEMKRVLNDWVAKHDHALEKGFDGSRVSGNPFWIDSKKDWDDFTAYEAEINKVINDYKLIVLCTYSLDKCGSNEVVDVVSNHEFALIKREKRWETIETAGHKKMEDALRKSEEQLKESSWRFRTMVDFTYGWEYWRGSRGNIIHMTPSCEKITGYKADEFIADPKLLEKIIHPDDWPKVALHVGGTQEAGGTYSADFRIITKDGSVRWIGHVCQPVFSADSMFIGRRASNRDITEQKIAEAKLRDELEISSKLASMSQMGAAVSHQLSNRVCIGMLLVESALQKELQDSKERERLKQVLDIFDGMKITIESMRSLMSGVASRDGKRKPVDINAILKSISVLASIDCKRDGIDLSCELAEGLPSMEAEAGDIDQVILNVTNNAMQAMKDGGKLFLKTLKNADGIDIIIKDTGKGIAPENRGKIFEPFFTASANGNGMGMGLSIANKIVNKYGGRISFESSEGRGTEFLIHFPAGGGN